MSRTNRRHAGPTVVVVCRMPVSLVQHLDACAGAQLISRNAEICSRLDQSTQGEWIDQHGVICTDSAKRTAVTDEPVNSEKVIDAIWILLDAIKRESVVRHGVMVRRAASSNK